MNYAVNNNNDPFSQNFLHPNSKGSVAPHVKQLPAELAKQPAHSRYDPTSLLTDLLRSLYSVSIIFQNSEGEEMEKQIREKKLAIKKRKKLNQDLKELHKEEAKAYKEVSKWESRRSTLETASTAVSLFNGIAALKDGLSYSGIANLGLGSFWGLVASKDFLADSYLKETLTSISQSRYATLAKVPTTLFQFYLTGGVPVSAILPVVSQGLAAIDYYVDYLIGQSQSDLKEIEAKSITKQHQLEKNKETIKQGLSKLNSLANVLKAISKAARRQSDITQKIINATKA